MYGTVQITELQSRPGGGGGNIIRGGATGGGDVFFDGSEGEMVGEARDPFACPLWGDNGKLFGGEAAGILKFSDGDECGDLALLVGGLETGACFRD